MSDDIKGPVPEAANAVDRPPRPLLSPRHQPTLAGLLVIAWLVGVTGWWWAGGFQGRLVNIDGVAPRQYQFVVNVNSADAAELRLLPGVGSTLSQRIVERRAGYGPYQNAEDLLEISGIGPKKLAKIRPFLAVDQPRQAGRN